MSVVRSMTGFAAVEGVLADGTGFSLTAKSVNHRHFDPQVRVPPGFGEVEDALRRMARTFVARGHVELTLDLASSPSGAAVVLDRELLQHMAKAWREAASIVGVEGTPDLAVLFRMPGILQAEQRQKRTSGELWRAIEGNATTLLQELNAMREREGAVLAQTVRENMARVADEVATLRSLRAAVREEQFVRLRSRLLELLQGGSLPVERIMAEAALLAERSDIEEELVRLEAHVSRATVLLEAGGSVGKQLDFILQELHREANTALSKTGSASGASSVPMTDSGLRIKTEIERAREQVQNLE